MGELDVDDWRLHGPNSSHLQPDMVPISQVLAWVPHGLDHVSRRLVGVQRIIIKSVYERSADLGCSIENSNVSFTIPARLADI